MATKLDHLLRSSVEAARQEKELATAKLVQATFMPVQKIDTAALTIIGYNKPASETGGDIWGHYPLQDGLELVYVADATGHGAAAAFVTAMAHACCMTVLAQQHNKPGPEVTGTVASMINNVLFKTTRSRMAMTFQAILIDTKTGDCWLTNAGHPFPMIVYRDGVKPAGKNAAFLRAAGNPLGMFEDSEHETIALRLEPGEKLVLYSDGLTEGREPGGKMLGREKVRRMVAAAKGDATALHDHIVSQAFQYFQGEEQDDDITIVIVERRPETPGEFSAVG
jgi:sigma-B regulation protein RsbU (phosphoserine phosphatase)